MGTLTMSRRRSEVSDAELISSARTGDLDPSGYLLTPLRGVPRG